MTISEALSLLSRLPSPLLGIMCDLTSLVTFTGIAANKTIPVNDIMFYWDTVDTEEKKDSVCRLKHFWYIHITVSVINTLR